MSCYHQQFKPRATEMAKILKVLSHPNRLLLLAAIGDEDLSVGELEEKTGIKQPVLSRELGRLRDEKLVETERLSKRVIYRLSGTLSENLLKVLCQAWSKEALPSNAPKSIIQNNTAFSGEPTSSKKRLRINPDPYRYDR